MENSKKNRAYIVGGFMVVVITIYVVRLFSLQVLDTEYKLKAQNNSIKKITIHPNRGLIFDRNGELLVFNDYVYDLMVSLPNRFKSFDTLGFCRILSIDTLSFNAHLTDARKHAYRRKGVFFKSLSSFQLSRLKEQLYRFPEFFIERRNDRRYKYPIAAHVFGYIGEINSRQLAKDSSGYYEPGDYIGKLGLEAFYEMELRGKKGLNNILVDVTGKTQGKYLGGAEDKVAESGVPIRSTLDRTLQQYGEKLLENKIGSIVAIEPQTGEILALVSNPNYDPNYFSILNRAIYFDSLNRSPLKPLYNRAVSNPYPPGSIFKTVMALIALQEGVITQHTTFKCFGGFRLGGLHVGCHGHMSYPDLPYSIITSCNAYYCNVLREILHQDKYKGDIHAGYNNWASYLNRFGIGQRLGMDVNSEAPGILKKPEYYDRLHGSSRWNYARIISLSIGQGELGLTPVQMANIAAIIANRGYFYTPHCVRSIGNDVDAIPGKFKERNEVGIDKKHFDLVVDAMNQVYHRGTAAGTRIASIEMCGKTGTAQNPHGKDHSIFMAFAPKDNPKIAIAVVVENAGYGATWAAPIASLMMEKYIHPDSTQSERPYIEQRILEGNLIQQTP